MASDQGSAGPHRGDRATFSGVGGSPRPPASGDRQGGAVAAGDGGTREGEGLEVVAEENGEEVDEKSEEVVASSHAVPKRRRIHVGMGIRGSHPHLELQRKSPVFGQGVWWKKERSNSGTLSSSKVYRLSLESYAWETVYEDSENDFPNTQTQ